MGLQTLDLWIYPKAGKYGLYTLNPLFKISFTSPGPS